MSINRAIGNAFSGLAAQSRAAEIVSRNLSNASVDGYAAREATLTHRVYGTQGGGVNVGATTRAGDPMLTASRRIATSETALQSGDAENLRALSDLLGIEGVDEGLTARYAAFEEALVNLADTPESATVQRSTAESATALARSFNVITTDARRVRLEADADIARQIDQVNDALAKIERLNKEIQAAAATGRDATGLEDERDRQIEVVNGIVPIRAKPVEGGAVELRSATGTLLVGHKAWPLSFEATAALDDASAYPSDLGGVYSTGSDGKAVSPDIAPSPGNPASGLRGGSLEAAFRMRDKTVPDFTIQLDAMAADLITRFQAVTQAGGADEAVSQPAAGLFSINGKADATGYLDPASTAGAITGLADRIRVNEAVLAAPFTLQKGLNANKTDIGDPAVPQGLLDAFTKPNELLGQSILDLLPANAGARGAREIASDFTALRQSMAHGAEIEASYRIGVSEALRETELAGTAVDTDAELRDLLAIEKAYAANARVLSVVDQMLNRILEI